MFLVSIWATYFRLPITLHLNKKRYFCIPGPPISFPCSPSLIPMFQVSFPCLWVSFPCLPQIAGVEVLRVTRRGPTAVHFLQAPLETGATVDMEVDWRRRFDHMQQHSGIRFSLIIHTLHCLVILKTQWGFPLVNVVNVTIQWPTVVHSEGRGRGVGVRGWGEGEDSYT